MVTDTAAGGPTPLRPQPRALIAFETARELRRRGRMLLSDPELLQMILPAIRADFSMRENYRYRSEPRWAARSPCWPATRTPVHRTDAGTLARSDGEQVHAAHP